jgi:glucosamine--fructose-6-phosphate aminotransferase (isomerizing)
MSVVMREEISEQPQVIAATLLQVDASSNQLKEIRDTKFSKVVFIARGTSDNVAAYGLYLIPIVGKIEAYSISPSLLNNYEVDVNFSETLVIAISQSGETQEIVEASKSAKSKGAKLISITNNHESSLEKISDFCLVTPAGIEIAVPATKTYTAALAALAAIVAEVFDSTALRAMLEKVPAIMQKQMQHPEIDPKIISLLKSSNTAVFAGRGIALGATFEAALKLKETCAINVIGTSVADFVHGPIAALSSSVPLVIFSANSDSAIYSGLIDLKNRAKATGAQIVSFGDFAKSDQLDLHVSIGDTKGLELVAPLVLAVPSQLLAAQVSDAKGLNADKPAVLNKVTQTA